MGGRPAGPTLRLLMVTPAFLPEMGGVERHVDEVCRRLAALGCAVTVLTTDRSGRLRRREDGDGFEIQRVRAWPEHADVRLAPRLGRRIREARWDLIHVQSYHTFVAPHAMAAAARSRVPYVVTFHGGGHSSALRNRIRPRHRAALRPLLARARRLVALADFEVELYSRELRLPRRRFALIPNGSRIMAAPAAAAPAPEDDGVLIASVGRLERYKGHHRAIAALPHVLEAEPSARLWVAGAGPYEDDLRDLARRLGVASRVELRAVPATDPDTMAAQLRRAAVVVLLSEFETHPMAAVEARALGRPLLVANAPGLRPFAERGEAAAVDLAAPPREVAAAMLRQIRSPIAAPPLEPFTWDACAGALLGLYRTVLEEARCAS